MVTRKVEIATARAWELRSFDDVNQFWSGVRSVPRRTQGRRHADEERYYLGLYLLALGTHGSLGYPLHVEHGESPDFMLTWPSGEVTGLEVTKMTTQWLQRAMTDDEREYLSRETVAAASGAQPEPVIRSLDDGLVGDEAEAKWCDLFKEAVARKLAKLPGFRRASRHDLLVSDDTPLGAVDRRKIVAALQPWLGGLDATALKLGTISVVISLDVVVDLRGSPRLLPYVEWDAPKLDGLGQASDLSERIEYAGWNAAKRALRIHAGERRSVYSMDSRGRLVKHTAEGQRYEVRVGEDGAEVVVKRLSRE